jgi:hypothetical protein
MPIANPRASHQKSSKLPPWQSLAGKAVDRQMTKTLPAGRAGGNSQKSR